MTKYKPNRAEIEAHGAKKSQQNTVTVPIQFQAQMQLNLMKVPYRSMSENEELIVRVMESAIAPLPRSRIARLIGRKKAPGINRLIEQLVVNGILCKHVVKRPNGVDMYLYEIQRWE
jgi:hypothetical protein